MQRNADNFGHEFWREFWREPETLKKQGREIRGKKFADKSADAKLEAQHLSEKLTGKLEPTKRWSSLSWSKSSWVRKASFPLITPPWGRVVWKLGPTRERLKLASSSCAVSSSKLEVGLSQSCWCSQAVQAVQASSKLCSSCCSEAVKAQCGRGSRLKALACQAVLLKGAASEAAVLKAAVVEAVLVEGLLVKALVKVGSYQAVFVKAAVFEACVFEAVRLQAALFPSCSLRSCARQSCLCRSCSLRSCSCRRCLG